MLITAVFETRQAEANDGKIVVTFTDNEGTSAEPYSCGVRIVSPIGVELCTIAGTLIEVAIGGSGSIEIDIPLDSNDDYLGGTYEFTVTYDNGDEPVPELDYTYTYSPLHTPNHLESTLITLTTLLDCDAETLVGTDTSDYTDVTRLTRALTITPPTVSGASASTTSGATVTAAVTYTNVTYETLLNVSFEWNEVVEDDDITAFISRGSARIYAENYVDCDPNLCALVQCLASKFQKLKNQAVSLGGWFYLPAQAQADYQYASTLISLGQNLRNCGEYEQAAPYIAEAATLLNCNCGCSDTTGPKPL